MGQVELVALPAVSSPWEGGRLLISRPKQMAPGVTGVRRAVIARAGAVAKRRQELAPAPGSRLNGDDMPFGQEPQARQRAQPDCRHYDWVTIYFTTRSRPSFPVFPIAFRLVM
jgi:hypothetical protein